MSDTLRARVDERNALLTTITDSLIVDKRVVAAWLSGSLGNGTADDLSDIDINIVLAEQYMRFVSNSTTEFVSRIPGLLLFEYDNKNAPKDGAYLLTLFHGASGPHQVDWYWHTDRLKSIPGNTRVLINHTDIKVDSLVFPSMVEMDISNESAKFWALVAIATKKIARGEPWSVVSLLGNMRSALNGIAWFIGDTELQPNHVDKRKIVPPVTASEQIAQLQSLIADMAAMEIRFDEDYSGPRAERMSSELAPLILLAQQIAAGPS